MTFSAAGRPRRPPAPRRTDGGPGTGRPAPADTAVSSRSGRIGPLRLKWWPARLTLGVRQHHTRRPRPGHRRRDRPELPAHHLPQL